MGQKCFPPALESSLFRSVKALGVQFVHCGSRWHTSTSCWQLPKSYGGTHWVLSPLPWRYRLISRCAYSLLTLNHSSFVVPSLLICQVLQLSHQSISLNSPMYFSPYRFYRPAHLQTTPLPLTGNKQNITGNFRTKNTANDITTFLYMWCNTKVMNLHVQELY